MRRGMTITLMAFVALGCHTIGVHSRTEAVNEARRRGLLRPALSIVA